MNEIKATFLRKDLFVLLETANPVITPGWGKMNTQEMIEHLAHFFDVSTERRKYDLVTPEEHLPKYKEFLLSEKQFRENTKAPSSILGETPLPLETTGIEEAKMKLNESVNNFFDYFKGRPGYKTMHPAFGMLDFDEWVLLHYKHITHHLRQFGLMENTV
jgi:oxepin-CoA hydrolase/3-oxo-5,6-dehydrosuberyl-CoA semialdehyde dehydrogenase